MLSTPQTFLDSPVRQGHAYGAHSDITVERWSAVRGGREAGVRRVGGGGGGGGWGGGTRGVREACQCP